VEISLYPIEDDYVPPIDAFCEALAARPGLEVVTDVMSTRVHGEWSAVMAALTETMGETLATHRGAFVLKVLGMDARAPHPQ
jgi:uncharacterized protein YqgV (UPF0045/DUF77 family)